MATGFLIPLSPSPQYFSITLVGVVYNLRFVYQSVELVGADPYAGLDQNTGSVVDTNNVGAWSMDIADVNNNPIVCGIPLVTGVDLLAQYQYLGIGGIMVVVSSDRSLVAPGFNDLGVTANLYFIPLSQTTP